MYLSEVKISGFKSFADRTRMVLGPGVTCVVGPNGCGKSNIVDAIRWVLGEQSAKAMRAGKMTDVIFEGTQTRKALGMCEVSLTFSDCESALGMGFSQVEVMRRTTREGSSDYFLNGKACRLKDIQRLFMDTGVGRVSYSFLVQGQIDQILSSNPLERRAIFEEAAGVTKYKAHRHEALQKLAQVEQNLARAQDVTAEMARQLASLERQVKKALRYQQLHHRALHLELAEQAYQYGQLVDALCALDARLSELRVSVKSEREAASKNEDLFKRGQQERTVLYETLQAVQKDIFAAQTERQQALSYMELARAKLEDRQGRQRALDKDLEEARNALERLESQSALVQAQRAEQRVRSTVSKAAYEEKNAQLTAAHKTLQAAQVAYGSTRAQLKQLEAARSKFQGEASLSQAQLQAAQAHNEELVKSLRPLSAELASATERLTFSNKALEENGAAQTLVQEQVAQAQAVFNVLQQKINAQQAVFKQAQQLQDALKAQLSGLEALKARFEGFSGGTKAILSGKLPAISVSAAKFLCEGVKIKSEYAQALESILGLALEGIALPENADLNGIASAMTAQKLTRVCFQLSGIASDLNNEEADPFLPAGVFHSRSAVEGELPNPLHRLLVGCYIFENLGDFLETIKTRPGFHFTCAAGRDGSLVDARGLVFLGKSSESSDRAALIEREAQIASLRDQLSAAEIRLKEEEAAFSELAKALESAQTELEKAKNQFNQTHQTHSAAAAHQKLAEDLAFRSKKALEAAQSQVATFSQKAKTAQEAHGKALQQLAQTQEALQSAQAAYQKAEINLENERTACQSAQSSASTAQIASLEAQQALALMESSADQLARQVQSLESRINGAQAQQKSLLEEVNGLESLAQKHLVQASEFEKIHAAHIAAEHAHKSNIAEFEAKLRELESALGLQRVALRESEQVLSGHEVRRAERHAEVSFIEERVRTEFNQEVSLIDWRQMFILAHKNPQNAQLKGLESEEPLEEPGNVDISAIDWIKIRAQIKGLRSKIANLGAVNLVAIEEFAAIKERHDFLAGQCADLRESKAQLTAAIEEINRTCEAFFRETFDKVCGHFSNTFVKLFGGGSAHLELTEDADILEAGIDIAASPPGTKLRSLTLLSGGQKTMTAVALLFAIYQVKPSPFCVLDELDAPLDDANIGRFTDMLREFTAFSQFMVITHNKRTLAAADSIYGVTMTERGVTQLVCVRLDNN